MKKRKLSGFLIISFVLGLSLACSSIGSQPQATEPTSSIYATAITTGGTHACALLNNGKVKCWGADDSGQLGDGSYTAYNRPVEVPGLSNVIAISAGGEHTCAVLNTGEVKCWGKNSSGQLGDGTKKLSAEPVNVHGLTNVISVSAGSEHTCAITKEGGAVCWGKNAFGRIGNGSNTRLLPLPVDVNGLTSGVSSLSAGNEHTCAVTNDGAIKCWGHNNYGQVGDDTTKNQTSPTDVVNLGHGAKAISTGFSTSCAVTQSSGIQCWGWIGSQDSYTSPQQLAGLEQNLVAVTAGADHICGLTEEEVVKCLGENEYGQLGNGTKNATYTATNVDGLGKVVSIAANFYYKCALLSSGEVFCWGSNSSGQLGNGTNTDSLRPVQVINISQ